MRDRYAPRVLTLPRSLSHLSFSAMVIVLLLIGSACGGDDDSDDSNGDAPVATETSADGGSGEADGEETPDDGESPAADGEVRYLAIGDSLSQGIGRDSFETDAFPARLAERWRDAGCTVELLNAGISGYTAAQMITDQVPNIESFGPTVITFQSGANDIANGETEDAYRENVATILDAATGSGATVYVLLQNEWFRAPAGPGYGGTPELREAYDAIMIEEAESRDVEILDLRPIYAQQADDNEWVEDGIHPTADAYDEWAEELANLIPQPCEG